MAKSNRYEELLPRKITPLEIAAPRGEFLQSAGRATDRKIEHCIAYMTAHLDRPMHVSTLAALVNVSLSHFFALFKQHTGSAPIDFFTRLRIDHACRLLGSGSASVKEVAAAVGYDDPFYFSRVFKAVNKVPPSQFRAARLNFSGRPAGASKVRVPSGMVTHTSGVAQSSHPRFLPGTRR